jgi:peptidoglycan hydrolase-like protein with peptidoglycan-binding domain
LQFTLAALGLYHGTLTQKYDKLTAEALAIFQSNNPPLRVDGVATPLALTQMGIYSGVDSEPPPLCLADARLGIGSKGASVKCLQDKLKEDGYFDAPSTGAFDKGTSDAVRAFQFATPPLGTDGVAGPSTLAAPRRRSRSPSTDCRTGSVSRSSARSAARSRTRSAWPTASRSRCSAATCSPPRSPSSRARAS